MWGESDALAGGIVPLRCVAPTMRRMSSDLRIVPSQPRYLTSFRATLDVVARERRFLIFLEAPTLDGIQQFVAGNLQRGGVQFFAVDEDEQVVGWCDINRHQR